MVTSAVGAIVIVVVLFIVIVVIVAPGDLTERLGIAAPIVVIAILLFLAWAALIAMVSAIF